MSDYDELKEEVRRLRRKVDEQAENIEKQTKFLEKITEIAERQEQERRLESFQQKYADWSRTYARDTTYRARFDISIAQRRIGDLQFSITQGEKYLKDEPSTPAYHAHFRQMIAYYERKMHEASEFLEGKRRTYVGVYQENPDWPLAWGDL